jgi:hypothetical protein
MRNHASILKREACLGSYVGGVPHVPKILLASFERQEKKKTSVPLTN